MWMGWLKSSKKNNVFKYGANFQIYNCFAGVSKLVLLIQLTFFLKRNSSFMKEITIDEYILSIECVKDVSVISLCSFNHQINIFSMANIRGKMAKSPNSCVSKKMAFRDRCYITEYNVNGHVPIRKPQVIWGCSCETVYLKVHCRFIFLAVNKESYLHKGIFISIEERQHNSDTLHLKIVSNC